MHFTMRSSSCRQCHDSLLHSQSVGNSSSTKIIHVATNIMLERMCRARSYSLGHLSWVSCSCPLWKPATGSTPTEGSAAPPRHPRPYPVQRMQPHAVLSMNHQLMLALLLLLLLLLLLVSRCILSGMRHKQSATSIHMISIKCMNTPRGCMHRHYSAQLLQGNLPLLALSLLCADFITLPAVAPACKQCVG